jgi:TetR/AcrR family transcriptional regulator
MSRPGKTRPAPSARETILQAAMREFAAEGIAGARTDEIARAAGVNKALLYYYYKDKETLYGATLDHVFSGLAERLGPVLESDLAPRAKILAYVGAHFDYVASSSCYPRVVMREMMRAGRSASPHLKHVAKTYFHPLQAKLFQVLQQGIAAGEFRPVSVQHFVMSVVALIVFYFAAAPMAAAMSGADPLAPERVAERRTAVLDMVSAALFRHPEPKSRKRVRAEVQA